MTSAYSVATSPSDSPAAKKTPASRKHKQEDSSSKGAAYYNECSLSQICPLCSQQHTLFGFSKFKDLRVEERINVAKENRLCFNCLRVGFYISSSCRLDRTCSVPGCGQKHTKFLHQVAREKSTLQETQVLLLIKRKIVQMHIVLSCITETSAHRNVYNVALKK